MTEKVTPKAVGSRGQAFAERAKSAWQARQQEAAADQTAVAWAERAADMLVELSRRTAS
ncbi:hypothetical protein ACWDUL_20795 [Nocardia niigatensis]